MGGEQSSNRPLGDPKIFRRDVSLRLRSLACCDQHREALIVQLTAVAENYNRNRNADRDSPLVEHVLREIKQLITLVRTPPEMTAELTLSCAAQDALQDRYPAPICFLHGVDDTEHGARIGEALGALTDDDRLSVAFINNLEAQAYRRREVLKVTPVHCASAPPELLALIGRRPPICAVTISARELDDLAPERREALAGFLDRRAIELREVFRLAPRGNAGRRTLRSWRVAPADWVLMHEVMDVLSQHHIPTRKPEQRRNLERLFDDVHHYAWGEATPEKAVAGEDRTANLETMYAQLSELEPAKLAVSRHLIKLERRPWDDTRPARMTFLSSLLYYLTDWSHELERRLDAGDYRPFRTKLARPTGSVPKLPPMPYLNPNWALWRKLLRFIEAAGLRPERPQKHRDGVRKGSQPVASGPEAEALP